MVGKATLILAASAIALIAAQGPPLFTRAEPGLWEVSGVPGTKAPVRQCFSEVATLARFEHRSSNCTAKIIDQSGSSANVDYSCGGAGFGHSEVDLLTPRSLRISTQGISGGLPFNYVLQARRVDDCTGSATGTRH